MLTAKKMFNLMAGRGFAETRAFCRSFSSKPEGWKNGVLTLSVGLPEKPCYTGGPCPTELPLHFLSPTWSFDEKKSPRTNSHGRPIQPYRGVPTLDAEFKTKLEGVLELYWRRMAKIVWHTSGVMTEEAVKKRMQYIWIHHGWKLDYTPSQYFEVLLHLYDRFGLSGILQSFWENLTGSDKFVTFTERAGCIGTTGKVLRSLVIDHMALFDSNVKEQSMIEVRTECFRDSSGQRWFKDILLYLDTKAGGLDLLQEMQLESRLRGKGMTWSKADSEIIYIPLPPV